MTKRKGQQTFRKKLIRSIGYCEVTASQLCLAMDACHIKPVCLCDDKERMDPHNSLLLLSSIHRVFDAGLISFSDDGEILVSSELDLWELPALGIDPTKRLRMPGNRPEYMKYHRNNIYKP